MGPQWPMPLRPFLFLTPGAGNEFDAGVRPDRRRRAALPADRGGRDRCRSRWVIDVPPGIAADARDGDPPRPRHELFGQTPAGRVQGLGVALLGEGLATGFA